MNKVILHTIVIYTLSHCPYCIKAKELLDSKKIKYEEIEVSKYTKTQRDELTNKAKGKDTVPQIFINNQPIGGCDDLHKLDNSGKLDELLTGL